MDLQYVEDVAATSVGALYAPLEGAHVFNLAGEVCSMEELIALIDRVRPGAGRLLTNQGPQVPVAYRDGRFATAAPCPRTDQDAAGSRHPPDH